MKALLSLLCLAAVAASALASDGLGRLAVQDRGRKKPFTTFAHETTLLLTGRSRVELPAENRTLDADDFLLALWFDPSGWEEKPVVLVDFLPLRQALGLPLDRKRFSFRELAGSDVLRKLKDDGDRQRRMNPTGGMTRLQRETDLVVNRLTAFADLAGGRAFAVVPDPASPTGAWATVDRTGELYPPEKSREAVTAFAHLAFAWSKHDARALDGAANELASDLRALSPNVYPKPWRLALEDRYLKVDPWRWAWILYGCAALVLALTGGWHPRAGYRLGWALALGGFAFQFGGFVCRIAIAGRPPVTNMYESIVWVSFGAVLFSLVLEAIHRPRWFLLAATPVAVVALMIVDFQPLVFDGSIQPLVPVLRNNFWLSIHVLTITLAYGAFTLAMGLGHIAVWKLLRNAPAETTRGLVQYVYRAMQIGVLLLATGTILGAVWANYSWGRFWDWDPKETWALITLLAYLVLLHGRFAGWWGGFAVAIGAIVCYLSVLMAWYGVNFVLGKGLHSYGFGTGGKAYIVAFVVFELAYVGAALWKRRSWRTTT